MADFTRLNASISSLDAKVTALLALPPSPEDPAIQAAIDSASNMVEATIAKVDAAHPGL